jgi:TonB family protein
MILSVRRAAAAALSMFSMGAAAQSSPPAAGSAPPARARCDSIVAAARVDSVASGLFISVSPLGGAEVRRHQLDVIANYLGAEFIAPRPFRLTVFSGPPLTRILRLLAADSVAVLRAPSVTGVFRFTAPRKGSTPQVRTVRASLMAGFDSGAISAIHGLAGLPSGFTSSDDEDSTMFEVRFSSDSTLGAQRLFSAYFPRMPVVDAVPSRDNPAAEFPDEARRDSIDGGEVVLRFVVDRDGLPALETVEVVRANVLAFVRAALAALPAQSFTPATVHGCAVAQVVDYAFTFVTPQPHRPSSRH